MIRVCMYCDRVYGEIEPYDDESSTHGICNGCMDEYFNGSIFDPDTRTWIRRSFIEPLNDNI